MASCNRNHLLKDPVSNLVTWGFGLHMYWWEWRGGHCFQSIPAYWTCTQRCVHGFMASSATYSHINLGKFLINLLEHWYHHNMEAVLWFHAGSFPEKNIMGTNIPKIDWSVRWSFYFLSYEKYAKNL